MKFSYTKHQQRVPFLRMFLMVASLVIVIVCLVTNVLLAGQTVGDGTAIKTLNTQYTTLLAQEKILEEQLAQHQSLQKVREEALQAGYVPITKVQYLNLARPVASR